MNIPISKDFISFKEVTVFLKSVLKKLPQLVDNELPFIDLLQSGCPPKAENVGYFPVASVLVILPANVFILQFLPTSYHVIS